MINDCQAGLSVIRDCAKLREWELRLLAQGGSTLAQNEAIRRAGGQVYQIPAGDWAVAVRGVIQDGFESLDAASLRGWQIVQESERG